MNWTLDPAHTSVEFAVRHMGLSTVRGRFHGVQGSLQTAEDGTPIALEAAVEAGTIDTAQPQRDQHLRSADFLHADAYPQLGFRAAAFEPAEAGRWRVSGELTMRDQTRPVTLDVEVSPPVNDKWGYRRVGVSATGRLNRKDWGLTWNQVLEFGALLVGEEVRVSIEAEVVTPAAQQSAA